MAEGEVGADVLLLLLLILKVAAQAGCSWYCAGVCLTDARGRGSAHRTCQQRAHLLAAVLVAEASEALEMEPATLNTILAKAMQVGTPCMPCQHGTCSNPVWRPTR